MNHDISSSTTYTPMMRKYTNTSSALRNNDNINIVDTNNSALSSTEQNTTAPIMHPKEYRTAISCFIIFGFLIWFSIEIGWKLIQERRKKNHEKQKLERIKKQIVTKKVINCPHKEKLSNASQEGQEQEFNKIDENDIQECLVCMELFNEGDIVVWSRSSPTCYHVYHAECLLPWLVNHNECPTCRSMFTAQSCKLCYHPVNDKPDEKVETQKSNLKFCKYHLFHCDDYIPSIEKTNENDEVENNVEGCVKIDINTISDDIGDNNVTRVSISSLLKKYVTEV